MSTPIIYKGLVLNNYGPGQMFADMVASGEKTLETRMGRNFSYRGDVVICCGKSKSVGPNGGLALCIVEVYGGRDMYNSDVDAAKIEFHPNRKVLLLRNWRRFSSLFPFAPQSIQKNFQGMFDMTVPEGIEIIPMPEIKGPCQHDQGTTAGHHPDQPSYCNICGEDV